MVDGLVDDYFAVDIAHDVQWAVKEGLDERGGHDQGFVTTQATIKGPQAKMYAEVWSS